MVALGKERQPLEGRAGNALTELVRVGLAVLSSEVSAVIIAAAVRAATETTDVTAAKVAVVTAAAAKGYVEARLALVTTEKKVGVTTAVEVREE